MRAAEAGMNGRSALRVLAVARSEAVRDQVVGALEGWRGAALEARLGSVKLHAAALPDLDQFDLLVLEPDVDDPADHEAVERLRGLARRERTGILVTAPNISPAV